MSDLEQYYSQAARELEYLRTLGQPSALAHLKQIDPTVFEFLTALLFEERGYPAVTTGKPGDEGVDVLLQDGEYAGVVQCKRYDGSVGQPTIRDLYGTMFHNKAEEAYLVTTGTVTKQAREWAFGKPIYLVDGDALAAWVTQSETDTGSGFSMRRAVGNGWVRWPLLIAGLLLFVWGLFYAGAQISNRFSDQPSAPQSVVMESDTTATESNSETDNSGTDNAGTGNTEADNEDSASVDSANVADTLTSAPATPVPATSVPATPVPATPVPATPVPATPVPATPVPATPVPATPAPQAPVSTDTPTAIPTTVPVPTKTATVKPTVAPLPVDTVTETAPTAESITEPTTENADGANAGTENSVPLIKPTLVNDPTITPTELPTPTTLPPTSTTAPVVQTCESAVSELLGASYSYEQLGCAMDEMQIVWAAWEPFERGMMLWRSDTDAVYAFVNEQQQWFQVYEKWDGESTAERPGPPPDSSPELQAPVRGFGYIWGTNDALFDLLGWATDEEKGLCLAVQDFEMGTILQSSQVESCTADNLFNQASTGNLPLFTTVAYENGAWE